MTAGTRAHHLRPPGGSLDLSVGTEEAGWRFLEVGVRQLAPDEQAVIAHDDRELALVPIEGRLTARAGELEVDLSRSSVFDAPPQVLYVPPGSPLSVTAVGPASFSFGTAPAMGRYPVRLFAPEEMRGELRGGGAARRQVSHVLAAPLPAERLIVYEIVAPRGAWCGWPPHRHDGSGGSPYLEESYWFRFDRPEGSALHRNYCSEEAFDEIFAVAGGDLVLVTKGYHTTVAAPGCNMYFLNFLAGELADDERARPPCFEQVHTWIVDQWDEGALSLPTGSIAGR
jgi:5-deoxy-glucuronate isomerase